MIEQYNLNVVKSTIAKIATLHGISEFDIANTHGLIGEENWSLNYKQNNNQENFLQTINDCIKYSLLYRTAQSNNDWLASLSGLMRIGDCLQTLSQTFSFFANDLTIVMKNSRRFSWPEIPDELKWPAEYQTNEPPSHGIIPLNFNLLRADIVRFAALHGIEPAAMRNEYRRIDCPNWQWDYTSEDIHTYFERNLMLFFEGVHLYNRAAKNQDMNAGYNGLIFAMNAAHDVSAFLNRGYHDFSLVILDSNSFTWPEFPANYKLPYHYVVEDR